MSGPPRPPPSDPLDSQIEELLDQRMEDLRLMRALDEEGVDPETVPGLAAALDAFAKADALVVLALARLSEAGFDPDLDVEGTVDAADQTIEDALATLPSRQAAEVIDAMDKVDVTEDDAWEDVHDLFESREKSAQPTAPRAPCPCGSGRRYGRCCGRRGAERTGPEIARSIHDLESGLASRLADFAEQEETDAFVRAAERYETLTRGDEGGMMSDAYLLYHANVGGRTVVDAWAEQNADELDEDEEAWLASNRRAVISLWAIEGVVRGQSLALHDLLTGDRRTVIERAASSTLERGSAICARVVDHAGISVIVGMHGQPIPTPEAQEIAAALLRALGDPERAPGPTLSREALVGKGSRRVFEAWCDAAAEQAVRSFPQIQNTSGEALEWTTDRFDLVRGRRSDVERAIAEIEHVATHKDLRIRI
jgi:hypothetical protein